MFAIDSMIRICQKAGKDLEIIWIKNEDLGSFLSELYQPIEHPKVKISVRELDKIPFIYSDRLMNFTRQRIYNSVLKIYQKTRFEAVFHASETALLKAKGYDFNELIQYSSVYLSSWGRLDRDKFDSKLFQPLNDIQGLLPIFDNKTIGVHIRRTDHLVVIAKTPLEKFFTIMDKELKKDPNVKFFIASDDDRVKDQLVEKYQDRILMESPLKADRSTSNGMKKAMIDLYALANTQKIIGTGLSTFTQMASEINGIELIDISE